MLCEQRQRGDGIDLGAERDGGEIDDEIIVVIGKGEGAAGCLGGGEAIDRRDTDEQEGIGGSGLGKGFLKVFGAHDGREFVGELAGAEQGGERRVDRGDERCVVIQRAGAAFHFADRGFFRRQPGADDDALVYLVDALEHLVANAAIKPAQVEAELGRGGDDIIVAAGLHGADGDDRRALRIDAAADDRLVAEDGLGGHDDGIDGEIGG